MLETFNERIGKNEIEELSTMKTWHKGMVIGGAALAVLVPAGLVAADQMGPGNGNGNGNGMGRGNGSMNQDCDREQMQARDGTGNRMGNQNGRRDGTGDRIQARDGTGARHDQIAATTTTVDG